MTKLKLASIADEKPVRISIEIPAAVHRDLTAYANALTTDQGQTLEPVKLIVPMLQRFMTSDRAFAKVRRQQSDTD